MSEQILRRICFVSGMIEGITLYAIWRNGEQRVGCMERPLKEVLWPYQSEIIELKSRLKPNETPR